MTTSEAISVSDSVLESYLSTALWSSTGDGETSLDDSFDTSDLAASAKAIAKTDLQGFLEQALPVLEQDSDFEYELEQVAHDFWLTRNGHGAGFWDGDYPQKMGRTLTDIAKTFGSLDLYVGDDGTLYFAGYEDYEGEEKWQG